MVRHLFTATVCLFVAVAFSSAMAEEGSSRQAQVDKEIQAIEMKWIQAEIDGDAETLRSILHEDFQASSSDREPVDRETFIARVTGYTAGQHVSQALSNRHLVVNGDTAVVLEDDTLRGTNEGKPFSVVMRLNATYVKRDGRWRALTLQSHALAPPDGN